MNHARVARNDIATDHQRLVVCPSVSRRSRGQAVAGFGWIVASLLYSLRFHGQSRLIVVCLGIAVAVGVIGLLKVVTPTDEAPRLWDGGLCSRDSSATA